MPDLPPQSSRRVLEPILAVALLLAAETATAQTTSPIALDSPTANSTTAATEDAGENKWSFSLSANVYVVPDDRDYVQPTFRSDRDRLHLEGRYNYEDLDTASVWVGYNFSVGDQLTLDFTAMIGGVAGRTQGVAPGYEFTLAWRGLELYSEAEYVIVTQDSSESFFYTWSELTWSPVAWLRAGLVIQRTKAYDTDFDIQRGFVVGVTYKQLDFAVYVLNPDDDPVTIFALGFEL